MCKILRVVGNCTFKVLNQFALQKSLTICGRKDIWSATNVISVSHRQRSALVNVIIKSLEKAILTNKMASRQITSKCVLLNSRMCTNLASFRGMHVAQLF